MQSSEGMIKLFRIIQMKIENNPILWKKLFMRIVNNRRQRFIRNCCENGDIC